MIQSNQNNLVTFSLNRSLLTAAVVLLGFISNGNCQDVWTLRNPLPTNSNLSGVAYGNGVYVAVGSGGGIISSTNGSDWTARNSSSANRLNDVAWGKDKFVVVGDGGTILTSPDGVTWTSQNTGSIQFLLSVAWADTEFLVTATDANSNEKILSSSDGITWRIKRSYWINGYVNSFHYANHNLFAYDTYGGSHLLFNGTNWIDTLILTNDSTRVFLKDIAWDGNRYIGISDGWAIIFTSPDGTTWTKQLYDTSTTLLSLFIINDLYVAVGFKNSMISVLTSSNATSWTKKTSPISSAIKTVAYAQNQFVAVGDLGAVYSSPDGETWTSHSSGITNSLYGIAWNGDKFVAAGFCKYWYDDPEERNAIVTSQNGIDWTLQSAGNLCQFLDIVWGKDQFVAVGWYGRIFSSSDGITWNNRTSDSTEWFSSVTYGNNQFVAMGQFVALGPDTGRRLYSFTSPDGATWTKNAGDTGVKIINQVKWINNQFIAVCPKGIITSPNGITWTNRLYVAKRNFFTIASGKNIIIATADSGWFYSSSEGVTWTDNRLSNTALSAFSIYYGNNEFIGRISSIYGNSILTSSDGLNWTTRVPNIAQGLTSIVWNGSQYIAVGVNGAIMTSSPPTSIKSKQSVFARQNAVAIVGNKVRFSLSSAAEVSILIYDIQGRLKRTLCNSQHGQGASVIEIPRDLPQGRYIISYKAGRFKADEQIVVVK